MREISEQRALDAQILGIRMEAGDVPELEREVDHTIEFPRKAKAVAAAHELHAAGYRVQLDSTGIFQVTATASIDSAVTADVVDQTSLWMIDLANRHGGEYGGWGSVIASHS